MYPPPPQLFSLASGSFCARTAVVVPAEVLLESAAKPRPMADGVCGRRVGLPCRHVGAWAPPLIGNAFLKSYLLIVPVRSEWGFQAAQERRLDRVGAARSTPQRISFVWPLATWPLPTAPKQKAGLPPGVPQPAGAIVLAYPSLGGDWVALPRPACNWHPGEPLARACGASCFSPAPLGPLARYSQACSGPSHALAPLAAS